MSGIPDPRVIEALEAAVTGDPTNSAVRLHLAGLLVDAGRARDAAAHLGPILAETPDDLEALRLATLAHRATGDGERADRYQRLHDALSGVDGPAPVEPAFSGPSVDPPQTADELLDLWATEAAPSEPDIGELTAPELTLADVGGMEAVKARLEQSFLAPMRNPDLLAAFHKNLRGGLLLYGPPGCGKTFIARACAGELGAKFYSVGLSDVLDMWIGASERNLTQIFEIARRHAPCVLFFDELDALGQKRSQLRGSGAMRGVVNQLLSELDGVAKHNEGIFVLAASNHPWDIDSALQRPGRLDRMLLVAPPDLAARQSILDYHLRHRPIEALDTASVAKKTAGHSGADLALICETATERALADSLSTGTVRAITNRDLVMAAREVKTTVGPWFETARNYALYANESGRFDDLLDYIRQNR